MTKSRKSVNDKKAIISTRVDKGLKDKFKETCVLHKTNMSEIFEDAMIRYLENKNVQYKFERVEARVIKLKSKQLEAKAKKLGLWNPKCDRCPFKNFIRYGPGKGRCSRWEEDVVFNERYGKWQNGCDKRKVFSMMREGGLDEELIPVQDNRVDVLIVDGKQEYVKKKLKDEKSIPLKKHLKKLYEKDRNSIPVEYYVPKAEERDWDDFGGFRIGDTVKKDGIIGKVMDFHINNGIMNMDIDNGLSASVWEFEKVREAEYPKSKPKPKPKPKPKSKPKPDPEPDPEPEPEPEPPESESESESKKDFTDEFIPEEEFVPDDDWGFNLED